MSGDRQKPYRRRSYGCAEDACEPFESAQEPPRPRSRAVRLVDEWGDSPASVTTLSGASGERTRTSLPVAAASRRASPPAGMAGDGYAVLSVQPWGEGETVAVVLSVPSPEADGGRERVRLHLLVEQYADLRPREGELSPEEADRLLEAGRLCAAVKRGMNLLQYGDQSARRLVYKLTVRGIPRETAEEAARYLTQKGYIHEEGTAALRARQGVRKLWGPRRIREDLRANGFAPEAIAEAMAELADVDFEENCVAVIRKKYAVPPCERSARQKMMAALLRLGYDPDIIRAACARAVESEK